MQCFEKWIEGISADDSVREAALHSVRIRLAAVQYHMPFAAERSDEDIEYVHKLRVATRRSMAALRLYAEVLPKKEAKWFHKMLRRIRRSAGNARDMDVLAQDHKTDSGKGAVAFLARVRKLRDAAQRPIVAIHRKLKRKDRFRQHIAALLGKGIEKGSNAADGSFGEWANSRLRSTLKRFFKASPSDRHNLQSLHRFRIRGKELRYAMELLAPAFPTELRRKLYPVVKQLQKHLGEIHDRAVAGSRFGKWAAETESKKETAHVRKLLKKERRKLEQKVSDFASWWTPGFEARFRDSLQRLIE